MLYALHQSTYLTRCSFFIDRFGYNSFSYTIKSITNNSNKFVGICSRFGKSREFIEKGKNSMKGWLHFAC